MVEDAWTLTAAVEAELALLDEALCGPAPPPRSPGRAPRREAGLAAGR
jgi:hypothetical protein